MPSTVNKMKVNGDNKHNFMPSLVVAENPSFFLPIFNLLLTHEVNKV